jgi:hypothetical protein
MDNDRYSLARRAFDKDYARILTTAKAHKDLKAYERILTSIGLNKLIDYGIVPLTLAGAAGAHYKFPGQHVDKRNKVLMGVGTVALLTNAWAFSSMQRKSGMEARLIEQYVIDLPDERLKRYAIRATFPLAK